MVAEVSAPPREMTLMLLCAKFQWRTWEVRLRKLERRDPSSSERELQSRERYCCRTCTAKRRIRSNSSPWSGERVFDQMVRAEIFVVK